MLAVLQQLQQVDHVEHHAIGRERWVDAAGNLDSSVGLPRALAADDHTHEVLVILIHAIPDSTEQPRAVVVVGLSEVLWRRRVLFLD